MIMPRHAYAHTHDTQSGDFVASVPAHKGPVTNLVITEAGVWSSSPKDNQILLWDRKVTIGTTRSPLSATISHLPRDTRHTRHTLNDER